MIAALGLVQPNDGTAPTPFPRSPYLAREADLLGAVTNRDASVANTSQRSKHSAPSRLKRRTRSTFAASIWGQSCVRGQALGDWPNVDSI